MRTAFLLLASFIGPLTCAGAEPGRSPITIHVLDTHRGKPAADMAVLLERAEGKQWKEIGKGKTGADGRIETLLPKDKHLAAGVYRLTFDTGAYFAANKTKTFYPQVAITFAVEKATEHYHVPLILSPFGYSTYRGN